MAGLWNRKFDYKNGEDRICKVCNEPYHTKKPKSLCRLCYNKKQRVIEEKKRAEYEKKDRYPFDTKRDAGLRFSKIRQDLRKAWDEGRESLTNHYTKQLNEAEELGIMKWIFDRRDKESLTESASKSVKLIRKEYPDTRGYYED